MKLIVMKSSAEIADAVSEIFIEQIKSKPDSVLGFATGTSPIETYNRIAEAYENGVISLKNITTFNLDEYCGLDHEHKDGYYFFMKKFLFGRTDVDFNKVNFLNGLAEDKESECLAYSKRLEEADIDIQLLGVGRNGHIGFNEPSDKFTDRAFCVKLTESTIEANKRLFDEGDSVPTHALTMGCADIMKSKKIILIATGESKAKAIKAMFEGDISPECPASILRMHRDVTVYADEASASLLSSSKQL